MSVPSAALWLLGRCRESPWDALTANEPAALLQPVLLVPLDRSMQPLVRTKTASCPYRRGYRPDRPKRGGRSRTWSGGDVTTSARASTLPARTVAPGGNPDYEYAIVYRGTVGGGGWMSNLRGLSAFTPAVWDPYHQAKTATRSIIRRVRTLHAGSDRIARRKTRTGITFTTVGHSLGAGLAQYIYLNNHRAKVMEECMDHSGKPTIFMPYEYGEIMTQLAPCVPGPVWGEEGEPKVAHAMPPT